MPICQSRSRQGYAPAQPNSRTACVSGCPCVRSVTRTIKVGSAGKIFSLTGWKIGFVCAAPPLLRVAAKVHQFLTFTTAPNLQAAVAYGLNKPAEYFYDMRKDLQAVAILSTYPLVAVVPATSSIRSLQDVVTASRKSALNAASAGTGTPQHLVLEMFKAATGANLNHIPYKGGAPAVSDLVGGQTDFMFSQSSELLPLIKSGKLRALAVTTESRLAQLPDVATTIELGFPGVVATGWNGLMVPTGTPNEIIARMHAEVTKIMSVDSMKSRLIEQGFLPITMSVAETAIFIDTDVERWHKVIREANVKTD